MRLIARLPDQRRADALAERLRSMGIGRDDMIVSDLSEDRLSGGVGKVAGTGLSMIGTAWNSLSGEAGALDEGDEGLEGNGGWSGDDGVVVAVRMPRHSAPEVRKAMERAGAVEIIQD
jgi:hypothetical protein